MARMSLAYPFIAALAAYLIGSIAFAVVVSRAMGLADPRSYGSHNPGATNVLRSGSKGAAALTLLLDALKGYAPVAAVKLWGPAWGLGEGSVALVALCAFLGHLWPVYFGFKGGKGVATAAGVLFAIEPWLGAATLLTWVIVAAFFRYSSLASVVSAVFAPFCDFLIWGGGPEAAAVTVMALLLLWRHRGNIRKLFDGTETRIGQKAGVGHATPAHKPRRPRHRT